MGTVEKSIIEDALSEIVDPHTGLDLVAGKSVKDCVVDDRNVSIDLVLGYPAKGWHPDLKQQVVDVVSKLRSSNRYKSGSKPKWCPTKCRKELPRLRACVM